MRVSSVIELQMGLQKEAAWRKKEVLDYRMLTTLPGMGHHAHPQAEPHYVIRGGLVLLCAHWEGYLKKSIQLYMDHVLAQRLRIRDLAPVFVANFYFQDVKNASGAAYPGSEENHIKLAKRILKGLDEQCLPNMAIWDVKTEGNPGTTVTERILLSVGLDPRLGLNNADWSAMKVFIDEHMLKDRHKIAHGEHHRVDSGEFANRVDRFLGLIDCLTELIIKSASDRKYASSV